MDDDAIIDFGEKIKQGAESVIYKKTHMGKPIIIKERFERKYRAPELDIQLTRARIRSEIRAIKRCKKAGIRTPEIYRVDEKRRIIIMEYIENSITVKEYLISIVENDVSLEMDRMKRLANDIGKAIGCMHSIGVHHGDLTTSNMLINKQDPGDFKLCMIDFGLSTGLESSENKAVDLHVLERSLQSSHSHIPGFFDHVLESYRIHYAKSDSVLNRLEEVRARGRKIVFG